MVNPPSPSHLTTGGWSESPGWDAARAQLDGLPGGIGLNIGHEAVDRHARADGGNRVALRIIRSEGTREISYAELQRATSRFAHGLERLGVGRGERVATLLESGLELYVTALGTLKRGAVFTPLFAAYGPEPVRARLAAGACTTLVTSRTIYQRHVAELRHAVPTLRHVILVDDGGSPPPPDGPGLHHFEHLLQEASDQYPTVATQPDDPALLHFTSGTTGTPKGVLHVHEAVVAHLATTRTVLDLGPEDVFWCTADPGWVTGTSYGIIGPLAVGATVVVDSRGFDAGRWCETLGAESVNVWYTAPTALRMIRGAQLPRITSEDGALRLIASVGEPLDAGTVEWSRDFFGIPVHDTWWQTETGAIMIAHPPHADVRPGAMGQPVPGIEAAVVRREDDDVVLLPDEVTGALALRKGWPSMFRGYVNHEERYHACFVGDWYLTGDIVRRDRDGYYWFVSREDDVIKSAGHLVGPAEVESVIRDHPAVADVAVVGAPDPVAHTIVKALVILHPGYLPSDELARDLRAHARRRLGPVLAPKQVAFTAELPRTPSGKVARRLIQAEEYDRS